MFLSLCRSVGVVRCGRRWLVGSGRRRLRCVVADAISDVAGARPVEYARGAVEFVAITTSSWCTACRPRDGFVERDFGGDVGAYSGGLFGRSLFKLGGHFEFQEVVFERRGIGGESAHGVEQSLILIVATFGCSNVIAYAVSRSVRNSTVRSGCIGK